MTKTFVFRKVLSFHSTEYLAQFSLQPSAGDVIGLSVLKLFKLSNGDLLFLEHAFNNIYKVCKPRMTKLGQEVRSKGTRIPYFTIHRFQCQLILRQISDYTT